MTLKNNYFKIIVQWKMGKDCEYVTHKKEIRTNMQKFTNNINKTSIIAAPYPVP